VSHATFLGLTNPPAIELGEKLVELAPKGLTRVFYSDNGSTAVEVALKMAFQYWHQNGKPGRTKFVTLEGGYHGDTVGAMSVGGIDLFHGVYKSLLFRSLRGPSTYAYRCPKAKSLPECGKHCLEEIEGILKSHAQELAALVVEPLIQGAGGMITQPPGFVKALRALCDRYDIFLIADEVMTGFGRTGRMFACEIEEVTPDFMAVSKGLTGGYLPLAATLTTERVYEGFLGDFKDRRTFFHGHTYTGNPLACAGALAALDLFERENLLEKTRKKIHHFGNLLQEFYMIDEVGDIRIGGLLAGIELVKNPETKEPYPGELRLGHRVTLEARKRGVIVRPLGDTLILMPPLVISDKDLERLVAVVAESTRAAIASVTS
jgi:adenosylmethionine-8-amino-7-oxononanoate aminotransferase